MRCDLHVHTIHSGMCGVPLMKHLCRECYSEPAAVYERLKGLGMDLVTVTDHDSIDVISALGHKPDFFLSEEVTCRMPSGTEAHIGVYDINERNHIEIQRRRNDLPALLAYLQENNILFALNHPFSALTGKRNLTDFNWFKSVFPAVEALNGHLLSANNSLAKQMAKWGRMTDLAGSDAHTLFSVGSAFTEVPGARTRDEFFAGLRSGRTKIHGQHGTYWKLTRDVLWIAMEMIMEKPATAVLLPLSLLLPLATCINYLTELHFARNWRCVPDRSTWGDGVSAPRTPIDSQEVTL